MSIQYIVRKNHLLDDPHACRATVVRKDSADLEAVIERMIERSTTVGEADIRGVLADYFSVVGSLVLEGNTVITPMAVYRASLKGVFLGEEDGFDPARHQVVARVSPGRRFRRLLRERAQVVKADSRALNPKLLAYHDIPTGERNGALTAGGLGRLVGRRLKFDADDPAQGIFFLSLGDGSAARVELVAMNLPAQLIFTVPSLPAGAYEVEVRTLVNDSEKLRQGRLDAVLTVS